MVTLKKVGEMFIEHRDRCCICLNPLKNCDLIIRNVPVYMGTVMSILEEDKRYNQKWSICENCGCIQLLELLPLE